MYFISEPSFTSPSGIFFFFFFDKQRVSPKVLISTIFSSAPQIPNYTAAAKSLQSCPTLCDPIDCSLPGSSVHGIFQARVLEWGAIAFST